MITYKQISHIFISPDLFSEFQIHICNIQLSLSIFLLYVSNTLQTSYVKKKKKPKWPLHQTLSSSSVPYLSKEIPPPLQLRKPETLELFLSYLSAVS